MYTAAREAPVAGDRSHIRVSTEPRTFAGRGGRQVLGGVILSGAKDRVGGARASRSFASLSMTGGRDSPRLRLPSPSNYGRHRAPQQASSIWSTWIRLAVLSWNLWIGRGRLDEVVARVRDAVDAPLVVLVQEAYRMDESVPARAAGRAARRAAGGFTPRPHPRADIVETARELRLNLRYVPSMRNGAGPSDRGNAILSDLPLDEAGAFELPLVLQRRVPVAATVRLPGGQLQAVSAHLDPRGPPGAAWLGVAGRAKQTEHLLERVSEDLAVLGADLNLGRGRRERSWRLLHEDGAFAMGVPARPTAWRC